MVAIIPLLCVGIAEGLCSTHLVFREVFKRLCAAELRRFHARKSQPKAQLSAEEAGPLGIKRHLLPYNLYATHVCRVCMQMSMHMSHVYIYYMEEAPALPLSSSRHQSQPSPRVRCPCRVSRHPEIQPRHDKRPAVKRQRNEMLVREQWRLAKRQTWSAGAPPSVQRRVSLSTNCERGKHSV